MTLLSRFPDMPKEEAKSYIRSVEHPEHVRVAMAIVGIMEPEELEMDEKAIYDEFHDWATRRREREFEARRVYTRRHRRRDMQAALRLARLRTEAQISDELLLLYGISGELPSQEQYLNFTDEEKYLFWDDRMQVRFGPGWRNAFPDVTLPVFLRQRSFWIAKEKNEWIKAGF